MGQQLKEVMFSSFSISVIQLLACFVILSLKTRLKNIMELAQEILHSLSIFPPIFSSQESFVIQTEPFMNAVLVTENAWQEDATVFSLERLVSALLIAIHICTVTFSSQEHAKKQFNLVSCATHQICVIWVADADLTPVRLPVANV